MQRVGLKAFVGKPGAKGEPGTSVSGQSVKRLLIARGYWLHTHEVKTVARLQSHLSNRLISRDADADGQV